MVEQGFRPVHVVVDLAGEDASKVLWKGKQSRRMCGEVHDLVEQWDLWKRMIKPPVLRWTWVPYVIANLLTGVFVSEVELVAPCRGVLGDHGL